MNPLISDYVLPPFEQIQADNVVPGIELVLKENRNQIEKLSKLENPNWKNLMYELEGVDIRLSKAWSPIGHLNAVKNTPEIREAHAKAEEMLVEYSTWVGQNKDLYHAILKVKNNDEYVSLNTAQQQAVDHAVRDFKLAGVGLEGDSAKKFAALTKELSKLTTQFQNNVMDCTDSWFYDVTDKSMLAGVPEAVIQAAQDKAKAAKVEGYRLGIDFPTYYAISKYADNQEIRKTLHKAYFTKASTLGPHDKKYDNSEVMKNIVRIRSELASILDFTSYAEYSLATKMAKDTDEVFEFLYSLAEKAKPFAQKDYEALRTFVKEKYNIDKVNPWDVSYYSEKQKQALFDISEEELRPYFPIDKVLSGMFEITNRLYGMTVKPHAGVETWHEDVTFYDIYDSSGELRGQFYLDPFARPNKRGGAWMDEALTRSKKTDGSIQTPVAFLVCNFQPASTGKPALLNHTEVLTLFHEFGHGLHHMMTQIETRDVSGINGVPWDAVELPSQFFENWCWQDDALQLISGHYETGEPLPAQQLEKLKQAKNYQSGMFILRQLEFAIYDLRIHKEFDKNKDDQLKNILDETRDQISVIPVAEYSRFENSFTHVFSGGYAAGYYSYLWAELLSADAFSLFEEQGIFNANTGKSFLNNILEKGGSEEPADLFAAFRGRAPKIDALLHSHGLI
jgi:oligopeptidase A